MPGIATEGDTTEGSGTYYDKDTTTNPSSNYDDTISVTLIGTIIGASSPDVQVNGKAVALVGDKVVHHNLSVPPGYTEYSQDDEISAGTVNVLVNGKAVAMEGSLWVDDVATNTVEPTVPNTLTGVVVGPSGTITNGSVDVLVT